MNKEQSYRQIIKYTGYFGGVQGLNILAGLVRNKIIAVFLGPVGIGLISLYNSALKLISDSTNCGISLSGVRYVSETPDGLERQHMIETVRRWCLITGIIGVALCCLLSPFLSYCYFDSSKEWLDFIWIAPIVGLTAFFSGELSILKATRHLKAVGIQSLIVACISLVVCTPLYYWFGIDGIVPSLVITALLTAITTIAFSFRQFPYTFTQPWSTSFKHGVGLVRLGVAFIFAGILGSGAEFLVRVFINQVGELEDVGLYNAGYLVVVTYASLVFLSLDNDFFPRLSAVNRDVKQSNIIVNRQIEVSVMLLAPLLQCFVLFLPIIIPLLYTSAFSGSIMMVRYGVLAMMFRAVMLPIEYLALAKSRSWVYLFSESIYDFIFVGSVCGGYSLWGIDGAGIGLLFAGLANCIFDIVISRYYFKFIITGRVIRCFVLQIALMSAMFIVVTFFSGWIYWICGLVCIISSSLFTYILVEREAKIFSTIISKIKRRG